MFVLLLALHTAHTDFFDTSFDSIIIGSFNIKLLQRDEPNLRVRIVVSRRAFMNFSATFQRFLGRFFFSSSSFQVSHDAICQGTIIFVIK